MNKSNNSNQPELKALKSYPLIFQEVLKGTLTSDEAKKAFDHDVADLKNALAQTVYDEGMKAWGKTEEDVAIERMEDTEQYVRNEEAKYLSSFSE